MVQSERLVQRFIQYVKIDSPTTEEALFAKQLVKDLTALGCDVRRDDAGEKVGCNTGNVIATLPAKDSSGPCILFSSHMDTVSPGRGICPVIKDGVIYSDGTTILGADDKAGVAAIIEALTVIQEQQLPHGPIEIVFSIYEEGGLHGAKNIDFDSLKATHAFIFDSSGDPGQIILNAPAQDKLQFTVHGVPAHAGVAPERGVSAIQVAAAAIHEMSLLRIDHETTANIGHINGGGATNIVAAEVRIQAEARSLNNDKLKKQSDHMISCFEVAAKNMGATVECSVERMYDAFHLTPQEPIVQNVMAAMKQVGITPVPDSSGGGSDTNVYNANGLKAVNLGIGEKNPHTLEEHITIQHLVQTAEIALAIIECYSQL